MPISTGVLQLLQKALVLETASLQNHDMTKSKEISVDVGEDAVWNQLLVLVPVFAVS